MIVTSMQMLRETLPQLRYPLLVLAMWQGHPRAVQRADNDRDVLEAGHYVLAGPPDAHVILTSMAGFDPTEDSPTRQRCASSLPR